MDFQDAISGLQERLLQFRGQFQAIADQDDALSVSWLSKFANGRMPNPTVNSLEALGRALDKHEENLKDAA